MKTVYVVTDSYRALMAVFSTESEAHIYVKQVEKEHGEFGLYVEEMPLDPDWCYCS